MLVLTGGRAEEGRRCSQTEIAVSPCDRRGRCPAESVRVGLFIMVCMHVSHLWVVFVLPLVLLILACVSSPFNPCRGGRWEQSRPWAQGAKEHGEHMGHGQAARVSSQPHTKSTYEYISTTD